MAIYYPTSVFYRLRCLRLGLLEILYGFEHLCGRFRIQIDLLGHTILYINDYLL